MNSKIIIFFVGFLFSLPAWSGDKEGNGGGSFVCIENNEILSAENQDLWEAQHVWGLNIGSSDMSEHDLSYHAISRLEEINPKFYNRVRIELDNVFQNREILSLAINELEPPVLRKDVCEKGIPKFVQAAVYFESNRLIYNQRIWSTYPTLHQAAQNVHEAIAKVFRVFYNEPTTERARRLVGLLFSSVSQKVLESFVPAYRFNPNSHLTYDEKIEDLKMRFSDGLLPLFPNPALGKRSIQRLCYKFPISNFIPRVISATYYDFIYGDKGRIWRMAHPFYDSETGRHSAFRAVWTVEDEDWDKYQEPNPNPRDISYEYEKNGEISRSDYKIKDDEFVHLRFVADENGDLFIAWHELEYGECLKHGWLGQCIEYSFINKIIKRIDYCPELKTNL